MNVQFFPAFKYRNYRLYFFGQLISLVGTWLQIVAQSWLVLELTNSAFLIGLIAALGTFPSLIFSLYGGVVVDRFPKKNILLFTQSASMILALILGVMTLFKIINIYEIAILAFLLGVVNAIDSPARQSYAIEIVGKEALGSAIALNSAIFNSARVIGPSIAGLLISVIGTGGSFIVNGVSYIAVIFALLLMRVHEEKRSIPLKTFLAIKEGIKYALNHSLIRSLLIYTGITSIFGWSYTTLVPLIAKNVFLSNASGIGYMFAASGLGALTATVIVSALSHKINRLYFIIGGNILFIISISLFTFTKSLLMSLPFLYFAGLGILLQFSMMNTTIQHSVENHLRGRVMSLYTLMFVGLFPLGNFQVGFIAEKISPFWAIRIGALIMFIFNLLILINIKRMIQKQ